ncbi:flavin reductase [Cellulophaga sp. HaHaR_3_176]|uniref:flavin reductase family protein n=1 Tax=Cellulophaga sp. HaHaR_3_176 TaxID=1942464 RepID=UPI001C1FEB55|nr:flavin reductase [Cellulophaga sp. HaHaR_3_176]QWX84957.1 flavin reductase [Cellulophaga sp. HaHaR_3_176]
MELNKEALKNLDRISRIKIMNSVSGIKPANLIATISNDGVTNVAVFSSVVHLGSDPALLGFILRPTGDVPRNTYNNILENKSYTINHIHPEFVEKAHYTSAKFDENISEFERCGLTEEYIEECKAPFVKESSFKMGMLFKEAIDIKLNGTILVIGEIQHLVLPAAELDKNHINLEYTDSVGISGLNSYYSLKKIADYPYARVNEVPDFK